MSATNNGLLVLVRILLSFMFIMSGFGKLSDISGTAGFIASGRVQGIPQATVVLRDPAGQRIDATTVDAQGGFRLAGLSRLPGPAQFRIEVLDAKRAVIDTATVPQYAIKPRKGQFVVYDKTAAALTRSGTLTGTRRSTGARATATRESQRTRR